MESPAIHDADDRVFSTESLARADWHRAPRILGLANRRFLSDSEDSDGEDEVHRFPGRIDSDRFMFQIASMENRRGPVRRHPRRGSAHHSSQTGPLHHSGPLNLISSGALHHSGPLNLINPGPSVSHSGPMKKGVAPKIIPAHLIGKKKVAYEGQEPMSPHVTCLGKVRIRHKDCKTAQKVAQEFTLCFKDQGKEKEGEGKKSRVKKPNEKNGTTSKHSSKTVAGLHDTEKDEMGAQLGIAMKPLGGVYETDDIGASARMRGEMLAKFMESWDEQSQRFGEETAEYVPSVPPANSLLLMRGISRNWENYPVDDDVNENVAQHEEMDDIISPTKHSLFLEAAKAEIVQHEVLIPKPLCDLDLWERRGVAKPCALSITNPSNKSIVGKIA